MTAAQLALLLVFSGIGLLVTAGAVTCLAFYWGRELVRWVEFRRAVHEVRKEDPGFYRRPAPPAPHTHADPAADQVWVPDERRWPL